MASKYVVPAGPWYGTAWNMLTEDEQFKLRYGQRRLPSGRVISIMIDVDTPTALFTDNDKVDISFDLAAGSSCPGSHKSDFCTTKCYAGGNALDLAQKRVTSYTMYPAVRRACLVREHWMRAMMMSPEGQQIFEDYMVTAISSVIRPTDPFFRWYGSGDIFTPRVAESMGRIVARTPHIWHWSPTRSWHLADNSKRWANGFESLFRNVGDGRIALRPSALDIDDMPPMLGGDWAGGTGLASKRDSRDIPTCPAKLQGNRCWPKGAAPSAACRRCYGAKWDATLETWVDAPEMKFGALDYPVH